MFPYEKGIETIQLETEMVKKKGKYKKSETQGLRPIILKKTVGMCIHYRGFLFNNKKFSK